MHWFVKRDSETEESNSSSSAVGIALAVVGFACGFTTIILSLITIHKKRKAKAMQNDAEGQARQEEGDNNSNLGGSPPHNNEHRRLSNPFVDPDSADPSSNPSNQAHSRVSPPPPAYNSASPTGYTPPPAYPN